MKIPMASKAKPDTIPFIYAIFLKCKGSIVEKRNLLILFSVCYVSLQTFDNFLIFFLVLYKC